MLIHSYHKGGLDESSPYNGKKGDSFDYLLINHYPIATQEMRKHGYGSKSMTREKRTPERISG